MVGPSEEREDRTQGAEAEPGARPAHGANGVGTPLWRRTPVVVLALLAFAGLLVLLAFRHPIERRFRGYRSGLLPAVPGERDAADGTGNPDVDRALRRAAESGLRVGVGRISGRVLTFDPAAAGVGPASRPFAGVRVLLRRGDPVPFGAGTDPQFAGRRDGGERRGETDGDPELLPGPTERELRADADGRFAFEDVPTGPWCVAVDTGSDSGVFEPVVVPILGGDVPVVLVAAPAERPAELLVRARAPHGGGYAGIVVAFPRPWSGSALFGQASRGVWSACDPLGVAVLRGLAGPDAELWAVAPDGAAERGTYVPVPRAPDSGADPARPTAPPVVSLMTGLAVRPYAVQAVAWGTGEPVEGLRVLCDDLGGRRVAVTDKAGVAAFAVGPDPVLHLGGRAADGRTFGTVRHVPAPDADGGTVRVTPTGALEGVVRAGVWKDADGVPVPGGAVVAWRSATTESGEPLNRRDRVIASPSERLRPRFAVTDAEGRFRIEDLPAGTDVCLFVAPGFVGRTTARQIVGEALPEDVLPGRTAIALLECWPVGDLLRGRIEGAAETVVGNAGDESAAQDVRVTCVPDPLFADDRGGPDTSLFRSVGRAAPDGSFVLPRVLRGIHAGDPSVVVRTFARGGSAGGTARSPGANVWMRAVADDPDSAASVPTVSGASGPVPFPVPPAASVAVAVRGPAGPVPGASVVGFLFADRTNGTTLVRATTDGAGEARFPEGRYRAFRVAARGFAEAEIRGANVAGGTGKDVVHAVTLVPVTPLTARVVQREPAQDGAPADAEAPVPGAVVQLADGRITRADLRGGVDGLDTANARSIRARGPRGATSAPVDLVPAGAPQATAGTVRLTAPAPRAPRAPARTAPPVPDGVLRVRVGTPDGEPVGSFRWTLSQVVGSGGRKSTKSVSGVANSGGDGGLDVRGDQAGVQAGEDWVDLPRSLFATDPAAPPLTLQVYGFRGDEGPLPLRAVSVVVPPGVPEIGVTPAPGASWQIRGVVTDTAGRPVPHAIVRLWRSPVPGMRPRSSASDVDAWLLADAEGEFRATTLPHSGPWTAEVCVPTVGRGVASVQVGDQDANVVVRSDGRDVTVRLLGEDRRPRAGRSVLLEVAPVDRPWDPVEYQAVSDARGDARFAYLPIGPRDRVNLRTAGADGNESFSLRDWDPEDATILLRSGD